MIRVPRAAQGGQWIYLHPEAELVIIRMGSEATPLDRVRGWRRGFDAIAEYFLLTREPLPSSPP